MAACFVLHLSNNKHAMYSVNAIGVVSLFFIIIILFLISHECSVWVHAATNAYNYLKYRLVLSPEDRPTSTAACST